MRAESTFGGRKAAHLAFFAVAFSLPWVTPRMAFLAACILIPANAWLLPHLLPTLFPAHRSGGGRLEAIHYPMALAACFLAATLRGPAPRWYLVPAAAWYALAVLDGLLGPAHARFPFFPLPWNARKSWIGLGIGSVSSALPAMALWYAFVSPQGWWIPLPACFALALVESVWFRIDDNFTVPFAATLLIVAIPTALTAFAPSVAGHGLSLRWPLLLVPAACGYWAYAARKLTAGGAWCGGLCASVLIMAQPGLFLFLVLFFALGVAATRIGFAGKQRRGLAEAGHGRRGAAEVFGSIGVATWITTAFFTAGTTSASTWPPGAWLVCAAPFVAKTMDTVSSEIGKAMGGATFILWPPRRSVPGAEGGVSWVGTWAGLIAASCCAALILPLHWGHAPQMLLLIATALAANVVESVYGSWVQQKGWDDGAHANILLTLTAAGLAYFIFLI